jgi:hypothetical protein
MAHKIILPTHIDDRGKLTVIEKLLPFEIKRVFFIYDVSEPRGGHRHHRCKMALVAFSGSVTVYCDNGKDKETFFLSHPGELLIVEPEDWHTMDFRPSSVLLVLASHFYDKNDYIFEAYS